MVYFQTNVGKFWRALDRKKMKLLMAVWNILRTFELFYDHLVHFFRFGYHGPRKIWQPCIAAR
jgi:hypothetical protein